jgi:hypothetical protein
MASFKQRNPTDFLIFGLPFTQLLTITAFAQELVSWSSKRLLKRLHLVGPPSLEANRLLRSMLPIDAIVQHGVLLDWELSSLLEKTGFCLTQSTENNYAKSGTFMAFASHGCPTIGKVSKNAPPFSFLVHPAEIGHYHYTELAQRAVALRNWYFSEHDWPIVTTKIAALISQSRIKS